MLWQARSMAVVHFCWCCQSSFSYSWCPDSKWVLLSFWHDFYLSQSFEMGCFLILMDGEEVLRFVGLQAFAAHVGGGGFGLSVNTRYRGGELLLSVYSFWWREQQYGSSIPFPVSSKKRSWNDVSGTSFCFWGGKVCAYVAEIALRYTHKQNL